MKLILIEHTKIAIVRLAGRGSFVRNMDAK